VGIHNGKCYVHEPLICYLTTEQEGTGLGLSKKLSFRQSQRRRTVSSERQARGQDTFRKLYLRNPIRLDDVPLDSQNAIVFVLEYMVSIPLDIHKVKENEPNENTKTSFVVRWTVWFPGKDKQVALNLYGGQVLLTDEVFVYKPSKTVLNSSEVLRETLKFDYRFDDEPIRHSIVTPKPELISAVPRRPTIPLEDEKSSRFEQHVVPSRAIPSALQPPVYHLNNLTPWSNFPLITNVNGKQAEMIDIRQSRLMNIQTETNDPMNCNEIHLYFLAYLRASTQQSKRSFPKNLFFTFKFYRFPETTTSR
ncbi:unnamed protein product, partial [Didymodactylos carnosus]